MFQIFSAAFEVRSLLVQSEGMSFPFNTVISFTVNIVSNKK